MWTMVDIGHVSIVCCPHVTYEFTVTGSSPGSLPAWLAEIMTEILEYVRRCPYRSMRPSRCTWHADATGYAVSGRNRWSWRTYLSTVLPSSLGRRVGDVGPTPGRGGLVGRADLCPHGYAGSRLTVKRSCGVRDDRTLTTALSAPGLGAVANGVSVRRVST